MKTLTKIIFAAVLSAAAVSYAGPGPQFWNRPAPKPAASTEVAKPAISQENSGLTCARMLVPKAGAFKQSPVTVVTCTPDMMKNDWRCQQACAKANKG